MINLHGLGETTAEQELLSGMSRKADETGFVVAYPEGQGDPVSWDLGPGPRGKADLDFIRDLVHRLESDLGVDPARVYATGISNGGGMASHLGCEAADTFAAIAPVSGAYLVSESCRPSRPVPVLAFHGTGDRVVPYDGQGRVLPPVRDWASGWAARNGCTQGPRQTFQNGDVIGESWEGCKDDATVTLYTIKDGGHTWPGSALGATKDIDATDVIWRFFADHVMRQ